MPKPNPGESHEDWMKRCMADGEQNKTFPDAEQRTAVCMNLWKEHSMSRIMPSKPNYLRAAFISPAKGVDRKANILRGYVVAQEGPFKSEGRGEFDRRSLEQIVRLGNSKVGGLKSRFTHPDMSSDGLGKFLGRSRDLRLDAAFDARTGKSVSAVRGDLYFDKTALDTPPEGGKPLGQYVMDLAESDPEALSSSLVLQVDEEQRLDKAGKPLLTEDGDPLPPLWRPKTLHASDIVDTGDAVDGLLSSQLDIEQLPLSVLWKGERLLDAVFLDQPRDVIEARLNAYIVRYLNRKFGEPGPGLPTPTLDARRLQMQEMALAAKKCLT